MGWPGECNNFFLSRKDAAVNHNNLLTVRINKAPGDRPRFEIKLLHFVRDVIIKTC